MALPTAAIASTTSSTGITLSIPANAISAATIAWAAAPALRFTQGTSTSPATGSHTNPNIFFKAIATACPTCLGLPPYSSTAAPAAIAAAEPHSA